jgi:hypothetical protein
MGRDETADRKNGRSKEDVMDAKENFMRMAKRSPGFVSQGSHPAGGVVSNEKAPLRRYRHSLNANDGIDSTCLGCSALVASSKDEWSLLEHERQHICSSNQSARKR